MGRIQKAHVSDSKELSDLTKRSKAYWGYTKEQMHVWADELTISADYIKLNQVYVMRGDKQKVIGYYAFHIISSTMVRLDHIFLEPDFIGTGFGEKLMVHFLARIREMGSLKVILDAEPNAEGFYQKFGFKKVTQLESAIPGRYLPVMELTLQ